MQYLLDIILLAVFAILVIRGWRRGFLESLLGLGRLVLAFIITNVFNSQVAAWLDKTFINPPVYSYVSNKLGGLAESANGSITDLFNSIPDSLSTHLGGDIAGVTGDIDATVAQWSRNISDGISGAVSSVLGTILLFVVSFLVLTIVLKLLSGVVKKLPIIGTVNSVLGLVLGVVSGIVVVILLSKVLGPFMIAIGQEDLVDASKILKLFA